jgi:hypothetical protein
MVHIEVSGPFPAENGLAGHRGELEMRAHIKKRSAIESDLYAVA